MICAWKELLAILPQWMRQDVDRTGRLSMQELRLRINAPPELVLGSGSHWLDRAVGLEDLQYCINTASKYSPWNATSFSQGYLTAPGGHRIGLCGQTVCKDGHITGIRDIRSVCIRVARDYSGIADMALSVTDSILILGAPGWGKSTLLRDLSRQIAKEELVCVVDERGELFPEGFQTGKRMDVMSGCPKTEGIDIALRTMGPQCIAVDEITAEKDCTALIRVSNCGVRLLATAHASSVCDFRNRCVYQALIKEHVFSTLLVLHPDKSYHMERIL